MLPNGRNGDGMPSSGSASLRKASNFFHARSARSWTRASHFARVSPGAGEFVALGQYQQDREPADLAGAGLPLRHHREERVELLERLLQVRRRRTPRPRAGRSRRPR